MKVDSEGKPVSEGTFGFHDDNTSAKVLRTFVDPTKDSDSEQEIIADGGYVVDLGAAGERVCAAEQFTATINPTTLKKGDWIRFSVAESGKTSNWSGTVSQTTADTASRKVRVHLDKPWSSKVTPGYEWWVHGKIIEVKSVSAADGWPTKAGLVHVGDLVRVSYCNCKGIWRVEGLPADYKQPTPPAKVLALEPMDELAKKLSTSLAKSASVTRAKHRGTAMLFSTDYIKEVVSRASALAEVEEEEEDFNDSEEI